VALPVLRRNQVPHRDKAVEQGDRSARGGNISAGHWSPWAEFAELHDRMGRLLRQAFGPGFGETFGTDMDSGLGEASRPGGWRPAVDVEEADEAYLVELELPGVKRDDVSVEFGGGELSVTGEVKQKERIGFLRTRTRPVGRFDYRVSLPSEVQEEQVSASLSDGVLTVRVPKTERARRRKIPISSG
jgi:HSP20 family protein